MGAVVQWCSPHPLADTFGPQLNPAVAVAAAVAAVPPIVFWARVFYNARKRVVEDEQREAARKVRLLHL